MKKLFAVVILVLTFSAFAQSAEDYRESANRGDAIAQYNIGFCYENGYGVTKDLSEAVKWYKMAAKQGDRDAQKRLKKLGVTW